MLEMLDRLCRYHHRLKTTKGWALVEGTGKRDFVPPEDPRHPRYSKGPKGPKARGARAPAARARARAAAPSPLMTVL
jgi:hypothetical protein